MRPLRVALITRPGSIPGQRNYGPWSYPVPEFAWTHFEVPKGSRMARDEFSDYDLIFWEDGKSVIEWEHDGPPLVYLVTDSTLSAEHYRIRCEQARQADLILVDWDRLERFEHLGKLVQRMSYCVNDLLFRDYGLERSVDVGFYASIKGNAERMSLDAWLRDFCASKGYVYEGGTRQGIEYARAFANCKIAVNLNRTPETRNHRVFDAMAAGACLLTSTLPLAEGLLAGSDYLEMGNRAEMAAMLSVVLTNGDYRLVAQRGCSLVRAAHTWAIRARQLRQMLAEVFPWLAS